MSDYVRLAYLRVMSSTTAPALPVRFHGQRSSIVAEAAALAAAPRADDVSGIAASDLQCSAHESPVQ